MDESLHLSGPPQFFVGDSVDGLAQIFRFLSFEDLNACRLVSKFWFHTSLRFWMTEAPRMRLSEKRKTANGDYGWWPTMTIATFLQRYHDESRDYSEFEGAALRQFNRFSLEFERPATNEPESKLYKLKQQFKRLSLKLRHSDGSKEMDKCELLYGFLTSCGCWITSLYFSIFEFPDMQTFEDVVYCKFTPELKELTLFNFCCVVSGGSSFGKQRRLPLNSVGDKEVNYHQKVNNTTKITSLSVHFSSKGRLPVRWTVFLDHHPKLKELQISEEGTGQSKIYKNGDWATLDPVFHLGETDKKK